MVGGIEMEIRNEVIENEEYVINLRRYFHKNPEASLKEFNTAKKIEEELEKLNIAYKRVGETGLIGFIGKDNRGKTIALRADIDALEIEDKKDVDYSSKHKGLMHACGHDAHTASLLGAAKMLKDKEDSLNGKVKLIFQQAEEIGQGAKIFVREGHLKDVDRVFGLHLSSGLETGKATITKGGIMASCDYFKARIKGKSGHVSAPHTAVDALYIASQAVVNLQSIVSRETDPVDPVVVGIGVLNSGTRYNIVANEAVLEGTFRTLSKETRNKTRESIERIFKNTVDSNGGDLELEFKDFASPLINEESSTDLAIEIGKNILGHDNIITNQEKRLGADDFAEFLVEVPGVYVNIGARNKLDRSTHYNHHHELFDIDEEALKISTEFYLSYALEYLNS